MDGPTAIITLPSIAALLVLLLVQGPAAYAVVPADAHVRTAYVHGEFHNGESALPANYFRATAD